jgi:hypothetical protein
VNVDYVPPTIPVSNLAISVMAKPGPAPLPRNQTPQTPQTQNPQPAAVRKKKGQHNEKNIKSNKKPAYKNVTII